MVVFFGMGIGYRIPAMGEVVKEIKKRPAGYLHLDLPSYVINYRSGAEDPVHRFYHKGKPTYGWVINPKKAYNNRFYLLPKRKLNKLEELKKLVLE